MALYLAVSQKNQFWPEILAFLWPSSVKAGWQGLEVLSDPELTERIRYKYSIKNLTGLNILPLITFTDPIDILLHYMVGSEGTLAFVSQVTMKTLPVSPQEADAMVYFLDMAEACRAVIAIKNLPVSAAEMLDKRSLASVNAGEIEGLTAVLIQTQAQNQHELPDNVKLITDTLKSFDTYGTVQFTTDPHEYGKFWAIRSGIFPTVGGMRKPGTTCLIEDVAFHIEDLADAVTDLSKILDKYEYEDSCIYGHALGAPLWTPAFPKAYNASRNIRTNEAEKVLKVVYFPSCLNQAMGIDKSSKGLKPLAEEMTELLQKAGYQVIMPERMDSLCCGTIWESKGMPDIAEKKVKELEEALFKASEGETLCSCRVYMDILEGSSYIYDYRYTCRFASDMFYKNHEAG